MPNRLRNFRVRTGAAAALLCAALLCTACEDDPSVNNFRAAASESVAEGLKQLLGGLIDGAFAAFEEDPPSGAGSSGSTLTPTG